MLDVGWTELLVIAVIMIVVVGPKDLPPMIRAFGKMTARLRRTAGEFRAQFDEALREAELDDLRQSVEDVRRLNPTNSLRDAINPLRQMGNEIKADLQKAATPPAAPAAAAPTAPAQEPVATSLPDMPSALVGVPADLVPPTSDPAPAAAKTAKAAPRKTKAPAAAKAEPASAKAAAPAKVTRAKAKVGTTEPAADQKAAAPKKPRKPKNEETA